ncbi:ankyrin repeat and MYND domain-containing protein 2 [Trichonephila inaurata madagascariensis]|uniref:Ankyrin repeat and MYND domain-containing protein 2 n=1 Tax=Trichonephila inaurata madagascariensis TaxID=2747483 RepID=A0A8X6YH00_9ARAC|nr:ankyrin repeat and MYND domain-containing protein 2 [Trichonephila inaurata madagascariensis]
MAAAQSELSFEKELFTYTKENNCKQVKHLLTNKKISVNSVDADGMTPLQHAADTGTYEMCKLLLDCGAEINLTKHFAQYSALTFAALSGNLDVVNLLLQSGASTTSVSSNNKTAAQMATSVGNHYIASVIDNFIHMNEVQHCCRLHIMPRKPKSASNLTPVMHKMSMLTNINPVRLALFSQNNLCILEHIEKVIEVFNLMSDRFYKREGKELISLKCFNIAYFLEECLIFLQFLIAKHKAEKEKSSENESDVKKESEKILTKNCLDPFIKYLIKGDHRGFPIALEELLRRGIQQYCHLENNYHLQLVITLKSVRLGAEPSAVSIINGAVDGHRGMDRSLRCATCGDAFAKKKCSSCKSVQYCDKTCQKLHWFTHKTQCRIFARTMPRKRAAEFENKSCSGDKKPTFSNSDGAGCSHHE